MTVSGGAALRRAREGAEEGLSGRSRFTRPTLAMLVAIGCALSRGFRFDNLHHFWGGSRDWVSRSKRLMSEGSLTGRLSLWRESWMVASVSP